MQAENEISFALKKVVNLNEIGAIIRAARKKEKLTQKQLAAELGVDPMTISLAENGSNRTGKGLLNKLAKRFDLTFDLTFPYDDENQ